MIGSAPIGANLVGGKMFQIRYIGRPGVSEFVGSSAVITVFGSAGESEFEGVEADVRNVLIGFAGSSSFEGSSAIITLIAEAGISVWEGVEANVSYLIEGVPDIVVSRGPCNEVTIFVRNLANTDVNVYRADDMNLNFQLIDRISVDTFLDTVNCDLNYKYKASFVVDGIIDGQPVSSESRKSVSKYTKHG